VCAATCAAETATRGQIGQTNQQVEAIKSEVLDIANSMIQLEETLIFPEKSRVSLFITLAEGDEVSLRRVSVKIDGKVVVTHSYKNKELNALNLGGAQRIYTGNISGGKHLLEVAATDSADKGAANKFEKFIFQKYMRPKVIEVSISGKTFGGHDVKFKE